MFFRTVIGEVPNHLEYKMASQTERLSEFAAVAIEVAVCLVSKYEKNILHPK